MKAAVALSAMTLAALVSGCSPQPEAEPADLRFPTGFQWGAAGAPQQSEGRNLHSDWQAFEEMGRVPPAGWAQNAYELYDTDFANAAAMHLNTVQFGIEWARLVPARPADPFAPLTRATVDPEALAHYHAVVNSALRHGLTPVVAVTHFSLPKWVDNPQAYDAKKNAFTDDSLGGWTSRDTGRALAAYAAFVVREFGDQVKWWITIDEPMVVLAAAFMSGDFPPGIKNLTTIVDPVEPGNQSVIDVMTNMIDAHARAWHAMKAVREDIHVGFAHNTVAWSPADAQKPVDVAATARVDHLYNQMFLDALTRGEFDRSLVEKGTPEAHPEWKGTLDYIGMNFYDHNAVVAVNDLLPPLNAFPCNWAVEDLWPLFGCPPPTFSEPAGLKQMLHEYYDRYHLPILITENGFIDTPEGKAKRLVEMLTALHEAMAEGVPVIGYHYWTLVYDYEWNSGWTQDMGLFTFQAIVDGLRPATDGTPGAPGPGSDFHRIPIEPMVGVYGEIAQKNAVPAHLR